jgi:hypothetical protein
MKRLLGIAAAIAIALTLLVPTALAANPLAHTGRVLISTGGDITIPADEHADAVVVVKGTATILGEVNAIVVVDGAVNLSGGRTESIIAVRSPVEIGPGSVVQGDVMTLDSAVHQTGNAVVQGQVTNLATVLVGIGLVLGPALVLIWIGFGLAMIAAGLLLAGLASRQVRAAETLISTEPVVTLAAGIVGLLLFPTVAILLIATVVGAPLGVGILLLAWPLVAFIGYLVAGVWIGEWLLRRTSPDRVRERPYLAAVLGVLILGVVAIVPILSIAVMFASLFGFGAVIVLSIRTLRSHQVARPTVASSMPAPMAS